MAKSSMPFLINFKYGKHVSNNDQFFVCCWTFIMTIHHIFRILFYIFDVTNIHRIPSGLFVVNGPLYVCSYVAYKNCLIKENIYPYSELYSRFTKTYFWRKQIYIYIYYFSYLFANVLVNFLKSKFWHVIIINQD